MGLVFDVPSLIFSSSYIYFGEDTRATFSDLTIYIGDVATSNLDTFDQRIMDSFKRIASEGIEMDRMSRLLNREERQVWAHRVVLPSPC